MSPGSKIHSGTRSKRSRVGTTVTVTFPPFLQRLTAVPILAACLPLRQGAQTIPFVLYFGLLLNYINNYVKTSFPSLQFGNTVA